MVLILLEWDNGLCVFAKVLICSAYMVMHSQWSPVSWGQEGSRENGTKLAPLWSGYGQGGMWCPLHCEPGVHGTVNLVFITAQWTWCSSPHSEPGVHHTFPSTFTHLEMCVTISFKMIKQSVSKSDQNVCNNQFQNDRSNNWTKLQ